VALALLLGACGVGRASDGGSGTQSVEQQTGGALDPRPDAVVTVTFDQIDQRLDDLVAEAGLSGAAIVVVPTTGDPHTHLVGDADLDRPLPLAESSMWLTSAVLLTLVDDGTLSLDEPVGAHLPWMTGPRAAITLRQLLSHTSGLPASVDCPPTPVSCDAAVGGAPLVDPPGEGFHVTDLDANVAARLAETVTGTPWPDLFAQRIATPTGATTTAYADPSTTGGLVAVDGTTTPNDLGRILAMVRDGGRVGTTQVLTNDSITAMLVDQTVRLDTHTEPWVGETGVPTYGLGVWRDRLRGDDVAAVVSAPNRFGLYPFVDIGQSAWGMVVVDDHTSERAAAVSSSAVLSQLSAAALRNSPG